MDERQKRRRSKCPICGKLFRPRKNVHPARAMFCADDCYAIARCKRKSKMNMASKRAREEAGPPKQPPALSVDPVLELAGEGLLSWLWPFDPDPLGGMNGLEPKHRSRDSRPEWATQTWREHGAFIGKNTAANPPA